MIQRTCDKPPALPAGYGKGLENLGNAHHALGGRDQLAQGRDRGFILPSCLRGAVAPEPADLLQLLVSQVLDLGTGVRNLQPNFLQGIWRGGSVRAGGPGRTENVWVPFYPSGRQAQTTGPRG